MAYGRRICCKICACKCSGTDKVAATLLISIIITVAFALSIAVIADFWQDRQTTIHCHWVIDYNNTIDICGYQTLNNVSESDECIDECSAMYTELSTIYYINSPSSDIHQTCYCLTQSQFKAINIYNITQSIYDEFCFELTNASDSDITKYIKDCPVGGRPYIYGNNEQLLSDIKYIKCTDYSYYEKNEWKTFITKYNEKENNTQSMQMLNHWLNQGLSEHASIATFAKFSLELMSIGAPLWIIELSNKAGLDEIKHTEISFDIANWYLNGVYQDNKCAIPNVLPQHSIHINGDWNKISFDTAVGGCFGETIAALTLHSNEYHNIIDEYLYDIAMEEIKHSALAWAVVKWMIDNAEYTMDITNKEWWQYQIENGKQRVSTIKVLHIYEYVIPLILDRMWITNDCSEFYQFVLENLIAIIGHDIYGLSCMSF